MITSNAAILIHKKNVFCIFDIFNNANYSMFTCSNMGCVGSQTLLCLN